MEKLKELISNCKFEVSLTVNCHRDIGDTVKAYFTLPWLEEALLDIEPEVFNKMVELNTVVELQFYPDSSVGFYKVYHYDVEMAVDEALTLFKN